MLARLVVYVLHKTVRARELRQKVSGSVRRVHWAHNWSVASRAHLDVTRQHARLNALAAAARTEQSLTLVHVAHVLRRHTRSVSVGAHQEARPVPGAD